MKNKFDKEVVDVRPYLKRYRKNILVPQIGLNGQRAIMAASVLVVGAGGLGCPVLQYLAAAGIGKIGIMDFDTVEESNLQRQTLYSMADIGFLKTERAAEKLKSINPLIEVHTYPVRLTAANALDILKNYDIVIDGSDNFPTRFLVNDACVILNKPLVFGALNQFEGQITVFNYQKGPNYRSLVPEYPDCSEAVNCDTSGILGAVAGMIGSMMAVETVKIITGAMGILSGKLLVVDSLSMQINLINFSTNESDIRITTLLDYETLCNAHVVVNSAKTVSKAFIEDYLRLDSEIQIIDLRQDDDFKIYALESSINIPYDRIESNLSSIRQDIPVVFVCNLGIKSCEIVEKLQKSYGYENLFSLEGGVLK